MTVYDILEYLAGGMAYEEILDDFPTSPLRTSSPASPSSPTAKRRFALVPLHGVEWTEEAFEVINEPWTRVSE